MPLPIKIAPQARGKEGPRYGSLEDPETGARVSAMRMEDMTPSRRYRKHALWGLAAAVAVVVAVGTFLGTRAPAKTEGDLGAIPLPISELDAISSFRISSYQSPQGLYAARITAPPEGAPCGSVLILAVGTALRTENYDPVAQGIVGLGEEHGHGGAVVVVVDHALNNPIKVSGSAYADAFKWIRKNFEGWVGDACASDVKYWIAGGHSAGGSAAYKALAKNQSLADGMLGLDPFDITVSGTNNKAGVYWGFSLTTCAVPKLMSARAFYGENSAKNRAIYVVDGPRSCPIGQGVTKCAYGHCSFVTKGDCEIKLLGISIPIPTCQTDPKNAFFTELAQSFATLIVSLQKGQWLTADFSDSSTLISTFTGLQKPPNMRSA